jgi:hypothetical protein
MKAKIKLSCAACDMLDLGGCGCFVEDFSMSNEE